MCVDMSGLGCRPFPIGEHGRRRTLARGRGAVRGDADCDLNILDSLCRSGIKLQRAESTAVAAGGSNEN